MERRDITGFKENREGRVRSDSCRSLVKMWKRKREEQEEGKGEEEFSRSSKKTMRSLDVEIGMGKGIEEMIRRLMIEGMKEVMKEIRETKGWREEVKEKIMEGGG